MSYTVRQAYIYITDHDVVYGQASIFVCCCTAYVFILIQLSLHCGRVRVVLPVKLIYSHLQVHNLALALG